MKTGMELVKELRELARDRLLLSQQVADARARGLFEVADLLQAWLRESDDWLVLVAGRYRISQYGLVREKLLGTTQKAKQEGEKHG